MEDRFDPNDTTQPNYQSKLKEHYKKVNLRLGVTFMPKISESRIEQDIKNKVNAQPSEPPIIEVHPEAPLEVMSEEKRQAIITGKYSIIDSHNTALSVKSMVQLLCLAYEVELSDITGPNRKAPILQLRANMVQALYIMYGPKLTLPKMAYAFNKDHTTILHITRSFNINKEATEYVEPVKISKPKKLRIGS